MSFDFQRKIILCLHVGSKIEVQLINKILRKTVTFTSQNQYSFEDQRIVCDLVTL